MRISRRSFEYEVVESPDLLARVQSICTRVGWTDIELIIAHKKVPLFGLRGGRLIVPVSFDELLGTEELEASIRYLHAHQPDVVRKALFRFWSPWLGLTILSLVPTALTGKPWIGIVALAFLGYYPVILRRGGGYALAGKVAARRFIDAGGDVEALLSGMLKADSEVINKGMGGPSFVGQARGTILGIASVAQLPIEKVQMIGMAVGAPAGLITLPESVPIWHKSSPYRLLVIMLLLVLLLVLSVATATLLRKA